MKCAICGKEFKGPCWSGEYADVCSDCFETRFWDLIVAEKEKHLVINGECYQVGPEPSEAQLQNGRRRSFLGCAGRAFKYVLLNDLKEEVRVTHNLWCQGKIPESHRAQLPDNGRWNM